MMGVVSSNIFRPQDAPDYIRNLFLPPSIPTPAQADNLTAALTTTACFGAIGMLLAGSLGTYMVFDNSRRNRVQGVNIDARDVATKVLKDGPASPNFRWFL